jgi:hypothetical protein
VQKREREKREKREERREKAGKKLIQTFISKRSYSSIVKVGVFSCNHYKDNIS